MVEMTSWCRDCDELCGVVVQVEGGRVLSIEGDPEHPITRGRGCDWGRGAAARLGSSGRWLQPRVRRQGAQVEVSWEEALEALSGELQRVVAERGARSVGVLMGPRMERSPRVLAAMQALRDALGPVRVFGQGASLEAPWRQVTRHMFGAPTVLRADLARAQHVLLLGAGMWEAGCQPGYAGQDLERRMQGGAGRKPPHVTAVDPRRTALAAAARVHLGARPGTELYLLLGMISAILRKGWWDLQHVADHTSGFEELVAALEPWSVTRAADLCGLAPADIVAEAMRFSRAATAVVLPAPQAFGTPWAGLVAWAAITLELLTANALKPGGLYASPFAEVLATEPVEELGGALGGGLEVLLCLEANPAAFPAAWLGRLNILACLDARADHAPEEAGWLLPGTGWIEEGDRWPADGADRHWFEETPPLCSPRGGCRPAAEVLADLAERIGHRGHSGSARGGDTGKRDGGPVDRARWAVSWGDGRARLLPPAFASRLRRHVPVLPDSAFPLALLGGARAGHGDTAHARRDVVLPASCGIEEGATVRVVSAFGTIDGRVVSGPDLRSDCVVVPADGALNPAALADPWHRDALGGRVWTDGQPVRVERR